MAEVARNNSEFSFEIIEHIGVLSERANDWSREVNIVSWNEGKPKIDIREWNKDHDRMSRGITMTPEEGEKLVESLGQRLTERQNEAKMKESVER